jgi:hypothetical protein
MRYVILAGVIGVCACGENKKITPVIDAGRIVTSPVCLDNDGDGIVGTGNCSAAPVVDCNDNDPNVSQTGSEVCNGIDDNCNGTIDEGLPVSSYYKDTDADGVGSTKMGEGCKAPPTGSVTQSGDCDDTNASIRPGNAESCNDIDDDCDGTKDNGIPFQDFYTDVDGDGFGQVDGMPVHSCASMVQGKVPNKSDCNDTNPTVKPGASELCNMVDDNCDGQIDNGISYASYYPDVDGDGFGSKNAAPESSCNVIAGKVTNNSDCNDALASVKPGAPEVCNGLDDNCDTNIDNGLAFTNYYTDADGDGFGALGSMGQMACAPMVGRVTNATDCNDMNASIKPGAPEVCNGVDDNCSATIDEGLTFVSYYVDSDGDGFGTGAAQVSCTPVAGRVSNNTDCNDTNSSIKPTAAEICNGVDENCDNQIDNGLTFNNYYTDADGDGFGAIAATAQNSCNPVPGKVTNRTDCNDTLATVKPGAVESCNAVDDNCDGLVDNGVTFSNYYTDTDGDGYGASNSTAQNSCSPVAGKVTNNTDCNDALASVKPGAPEVCNGVDDNCNSQIDDGLVFKNYYVDADSDGHGRANSTAVNACLQPVGRVLTNDDCNDTLGTVFPGATEMCNMVDDNCDGLVDNGIATASYYPDLDGDTFGASAAVAQVSCAPVVGKVTNNTDCNDGNAAIKPSAAEVCNAIDDNCNNQVDEGFAVLSYYPDVDGDGFGLSSATAQNSCAPISGKVTNNTDCNDSNAAIKPNAIEVCNMIDDNCVAGIDEGLPTQSYYPDADFDTFGSSVATAQVSCAPVSGKVTNRTDCNDSNGAIRPNATEVCNMVDDNCAGGIDEGLPTQSYYPDVDMDTFGAVGSTAQVYCAAIAGKVANNTDCNDNNASIRPNATETCNGIDDNCAAGIDEGNPGGGGACSTGLSGVCGPGTMACSMGMLRCNQNTTSSVEKCNALDDNCNGSTDETFPGVGTSCSAGLGVCLSNGTIVCSGDQLSASCNAVPGAPTAAACDSLDNDCDGIIDEPAITSTVDVGTTPFTDVEVQPYYNSVCQGGVLGTGVDALAGGALMMGNATGGISYQRLDVAGAPVGAPVASIIPNYTDMAFAQAGEGYLVAGVWVNNNAEIDLYYVEAATGIRRALKFTQFRLPVGCTTNCNTLDSIRVVRGNGKRVTVIWRENTVGIKMAQVEPCNIAGTWEIRAPGCVSTTLTPVTLVAGASIQSGIGADSNMKDWEPTQTCDAVASLRKIGVAYRPTASAMNFFKVNEDGSAKEADTALILGTATLAATEPEVAFFKDSLGADSYIAAFLEKDSAALRTDLNWWQTNEPTFIHFAYDAFAVLNAADSISRPRLSVNSTHIQMSAMRWVNDPSAFKKQLMTRKIDLITNKVPVSNMVEISATFGACVPTDTACRPGDKSNFTQWLPFGKIYYAGSGAAPTGVFASSLTCQ